MRRNRNFPARTKWLGLALCACVPTAAIGLSAAPGKRIRLAPKFVRGETLRYRVESRTTTTGKTTTPILNPEGGTRANLLIHLLVRLDVLDFPGHSGLARLRATYEESSAESDSDAFDPAQPSLADEYAHLQGRSIELTLGTGAQATDVQGLSEVLADQSTAQSVLTWFGGVAASSGFPSGGIEIGQRWKSERPVEGAPLVGLAWRVESTYLRDEPCAPSANSSASPPPASGTESCAVILSRFEISRRGAASSDVTPEDYRRNGLRVSGTWTGSGEVLDSISLSTGLLVRSTQTFDQQMDYRITSASTGSSVRNQSHVQTQSEVTLAPAASPAPSS